MHCIECNCELTEENFFKGEDDNYYYCEDCYYNNYTSCDRCENYHLNDNMHYIDDYCYCNYCYTNYYEETIKDYHNRDIDITFKHTKDIENEKLYYGFELEVENIKDYISNNDMACLIRSEFKDLELCFQTDGSLENGFEIISQPMSRKYLEKHFKDFHRILDLLIENGFESHNGGRCGLHIHVSKNGLGKDIDKNINKLLLFTETYKKELKNFSRRNDFYYCKFISDNNCYSNDRYYKSTKILEEEEKKKVRFSVINTNNENTIEFRVFRGTLKYSTFKATLDFMDNLINIIINNPISKISWDKVIKYNPTNELISYVENRKIFNSSYMTDESKNIEKEYKEKLKRLELVKKEYQTTLKNIYNDVNKFCKNLSLDINEINNINKINTNCNELNLKSKLYEKLSNLIYLFKDNDLNNSYIEILNKDFNQYNKTINNLIQDINYILSTINNDINNKFSKEIKKYIDILKKYTVLESEEI